MKNFAIQLYSVRNELEADFDGTLKALANMGYDAVEFYGGYYGNLSAEQLKQKLEFYGLDAISAHIGLDELENNLDYHLDMLSSIGCKVVVCPWSDVKTVDDAKDLGNRLLKIAEKCAVRGMEFGYHNHAHEFQKPDGENTLLDIILSIGDPLVLAELDLGWVANAGFDPEEYIRKYAGRVTYLHLKQFKKTGENLEVSTLENGILNVENSIKVGSLMGCEHFIVEQDRADLKAAKQNIEYLKSLNV